MKNNTKITGMVIRKYRLEQNMSQEALCQGICAVSYLSKIEKGLVICSDEILSKLFDVLGISIPENIESLSIYEEKINDFFKHFFFSTPHPQEADEIAKELHPHRDLLLHTYLALDMMLLEAYHQFAHIHEYPELKGLLMELLQYQEYMDQLQSYRLYLLLGFYETYTNNDYIAGLNYYKLAENRKTDGILLESLATVYYLMGDYLQSITLGDQAYTKLMEGGYFYRAINLCFVIAAAYANYKNHDKMMEYYNRILDLNRFTKDESKTTMVHYNIGSTYLIAKDYHRALYYLNKAYETSKEHLFLLQKLFLSYMALGRKEEAQVYLALAAELHKKLPTEETWSSFEPVLDWMKIMLENENYLQDEHYLQSIKTIYEASLKTSHHGFHLFYGNYLIEAYKVQRKYKEALKITEDLYVKNEFS